MNTKTIVWTVVVLAIIIIGFMVMNGNEAGAPETATSTATSTIDTPASTPITPTATSSVSTTGQVRSFTVTAGNFAFSEKTLSVKQGDIVRLTFKNTEGTHDWRLDEFNAKTDTLNAGKEQTIEFVADKAGSFEYYCSVGNHRQMGMTGMLVVTK
jgi:plastocyanin